MNYMTCTEWRHNEKRILYQETCWHCPHSMKIEFSWVFRGFYLANHSEYIYNIKDYETVKYWQYHSQNKFFKYHSPLNNSYNNFLKSYFDKSNSLIPLREMNSLIIKSKVKLEPLYDDTERYSWSRIKTLNYSSYTELVRMVKILRYRRPEALA